MTAPVDYAGEAKRLQRLEAAIYAYTGMADVESLLAFLETQRDKTRIAQQEAEAAKRAQKAAEDYFKSGLLRNRADMTYLLARAHEYQLRLHDASEKYLELGDKYPRHTRAATSLARSEKH